MTVQDERLISPEEHDVLFSQELVPIDVVPVATPTAKTSGLRKTWDRQIKRARKGHGFWGDTPTGVRALNQELSDLANAKEAALSKYALLGYSWLVAQPITAVILGFLRVIDLPIYRDKWEGTPPSLSQLYNAVHNRGWLARGYGVAVILTHAVSYALMCIGQRYERLIASALILSAFIFADYL